MNESFFSVKEFAIYVKLHPNTIYRSIKAGRLQAIKIGSGKKAIFRIPASEVNRLAELDVRDILKDLIKNEIGRLQQ